MRFNPAVALFVTALFAGSWVAGCADRNGAGSVMPGLPGGELSPAGSSAASTARVIFKIVVPAHPVSKLNPNAVSPATRGVGVTVTAADGDKLATHFFFALNSKQKYCKGGAPARLVCTLVSLVPAGKDALSISGHAGATPKSPVLGTAAFTLNVTAGSTRHVNVSMGGVVAFLAAALTDPFPTRAAATIPIDVIAADAWGYLIVGMYESPIAVTDSDTSDKTKLSTSSLKSSSEAATLSLQYNGKKLKKAAVIELTVGDGARERDASTSLDPGGRGIVTSPSIALVSPGYAVAVNAGGPGTRAPFVVSTEKDARGDPACAGIADVVQAGSDFGVVASKTLGLCWLAISDSKGHRGSLPVLVSSFAWGYTAATPTPPPVPTPTPFATSTTIPVPKMTPAPPGQTPKPLPLPSTNSVRGSIGFTVRHSGGIPPGTSLVSTLTNSVPSTVVPPPFTMKRRDSSSSFTTLLGLELVFNNNIELANAPAFNFTLPSSQIVNGASYWLALYDTTRANLGWQTGFEGPATVNGTSVSFSASGSDFYFSAWQPYYFALYSQSVALATATPAPPATAPPTPGNTPTPQPTPAFPVTPATMSFIATGETKAFTASGAAPYNAFTSNASVVTVNPSAGSGPFTVTAGRNGKATITVADANGNTAFVAVTVSNTYATVYNFRGGSDGANPAYGDLIDVNGTLYGTTYYGGGTSGCTIGSSPSGCGTVFGVNPSTGKETVIYRFQGGSDGANPLGGLVAIGNTLYGTTFSGGSGGCPASGLSVSGCGIVFSVTTAGAERVLYSFQGNNDGQFPQADMVIVSGMLYGTTNSGGASRSGTIFQVSPGTGAESVVYSFQNGRDGVSPQALIAVGGTLYGSTYAGGATGCYNNNGCGTVFEASTTGTERVLYRFQGAPDGAQPTVNLLYIGGTLYGTTGIGGNTACQTTGNGCGIVYAVNASSGAEKVLYRFSGSPDGQFPLQGLTGVNGTLYGTTFVGGYGNAGTIYSVTGAGVENVLYSFRSGYDGVRPQGGLTDVSGTLYGTTRQAGAYGQGTIYRITP